MGKTIAPDHEKARTCYKAQLIFTSGCTASVDHLDVMDTFIKSECPTKKFGTWNSKYVIINEDDEILYPHFKEKVFCEHCYNELIGNIGIAKKHTTEMLEKQKYRCIKYKKSCPMDISKTQTKEQTKTKNNCISKIKLTQKDITLELIMKVISHTYDEYPCTCYKCDECDDYDKMIQKYRQRIQYYAELHEKLQHELYTEKIKNREINEYIDYYIAILKIIFSIVLVQLLFSCN